MSVWSSVSFSELYKRGNMSICNLGFTSPSSSPLSPYEGGRVADIPGGMLRSATRTGLNSITQKEGSCNFSGFGFRPRLKIEIGEKYQYHTP